MLTEAWGGDQAFALLVQWNLSVVKASLRRGNFFTYAISVQSNNREIINCIHIKETIRDINKVLTCNFTKNLHILKMLIKWECIAYGNSVTSGGPTLKLMKQLLLLLLLMSEFFNNIDGVCIKIRLF